MAITDLIFGEPTKASLGVLTNPLIGLLEFDCSVDEVHTGEAEATDHPVEFGSVITDHVRRLPEVIELNGLVTNTPIVYLASVFAKSPILTDVVPTLDRADAAYKKLLEFKDNGTQIDVVTSLRTYSGMVITSLVVTRNAATGNVLNCTVSLREILTSTSLAIDAPIPDDVANNAAANAGQASKGAANAAQTSTSQSVLSSFASFFGG